MDTKNVVLDWQTQIVNDWFNSTDPGGLIDCATKYKLFNDLTESGFIIIHDDFKFRRAEVKNQVKAWFRHKLNHLRKQLAKDDARLFIVRGCMAQQCFGFTNRLKEYLHSIHPDEDTLIRYANRFTSRFVNLSPNMIVPEKFFSQYLDEIFAFCESSLKKVTFITSDYLITNELCGIVRDFFPAGSTTIYDGRDASLVNTKEHIIFLVNSVEYFVDLFTKNGLTIPDLDSSETQIVEFAMNEVLEKLKKSI